jgi:hypothetical protein
MEQFGALSRRRLNGKTRNFLNPALLEGGKETPKPRPFPDERSCCWEGSVQEAVVRYLQKLDFQIEWVSNTASKQKGKDVIAISPSGETVWISAKGHPMGTIKTNRRTQARHWFSHSTFDLLLWHGENASVSLALALPDQITYRNLSKRVSWFLDELKASIYWVGPEGAVRKQEF